jgi:hypothetical protein
MNRDYAATLTTAVKNGLGSRLTEYNYKTFLLDIGEILIYNVGNP